MKPPGPFSVSGASIAPASPWTRKPDSEQCCGHRRATRVGSWRGLVHATCDNCGHTWREVAYPNALPAHADVAARHAGWLRAMFAAVALLLSACTIETAGATDLFELGGALAWQQCDNADAIPIRPRDLYVRIGATDWTCAAGSKGVACRLADDPASEISLACTPSATVSSVVLGPCVVQIACE